MTKSVVVNTVGWQVKGSIGETQIIFGVVAERTSGAKLTDLQCRPLVAKEHLKVAVMLLHLTNQQ